MNPTDQAPLELLESAAASGAVQESSVENIRRWLTDESLAEFAPRVARMLEQEQYRELNDAFWNVIPFGTGGRRGTMAELGSATINDRTMGESAAGLARYVKSQAKPDTNFSVAIAYDTRHKSTHFARLCAEIMAAEGFTVYFLNGVRSTPELSFAVRYHRCCCGIMITASHNPPADNGFKAYWSTGGQILPPHDQGVIERVLTTGRIARVPFDEALSDGRIRFCQDEVDAAYLEQVAAQAFPGPRNLKLIYSPLHGVGASGVMAALAADGFEEVELFAPHAEPDGDFPNVPQHSANPENPRVFDALVERARQTGAELVLATDPDGDRVGCSAPVTPDLAGEWRSLTGNQIAALLAEYILARRAENGTLSPRSYIVKTLVTTELVRRIADKYGVATHGNLLVGFKWIGQVIDEQGPDDFLLGTEESHGYLVGQYARDKDGVVATMLLSEAAASAKAEGLSLHEKLESLFAEHGVHAERTISITLPGAAGMEAMQRMLARIRETPPRSLGGLEVVRVRDYAAQTVRSSGGETRPLDGPRGDMVILDLAEEGNYVAVRPSGTEPKVKFYLFTYLPPQADVTAARAALEERLDRLERELQELAQD